MTVDLSDLVLLGLLSTGLHWLIARSKVMEPLWSRARGRVAELLACPACSGWWIGGALWLANVRPVSMCDLQGPEVLIGGVNMLATATLALVLTPIFESVLLWGLERSAISTGPIEDENSGT